MQTSAPVLVLGAGTMGVGIAQVAAQAGHVVHLFDVRAGAATAAKRGLAATWDKLAGKGKLTPEAASACATRIVPVDAIGDARDARLAIEAVVERLDVKQALLRELEGALSEDAVLATNTSSISVTALAAGLARPERVVGMHFFNPVPVMNLVEIVSGLHTDRAVADAVFALVKAWGKVPVHARSTPGFIVNRIARAFYAETWALLQEQAAAPQTIDACLRGAGFRMGPCELMDLIGHDAVLQGVCTEAAADAAMKLGVNYPAGPFEWLERWGTARVVAVIDHLDAHYRGERYRASPALRQRAWACA